MADRDRSLKYQGLYNLLLLQKTLALQEAFSPFTLIIDTVEQSAKPLIQRCIQSAKASKVATIFVSFETVKAPSDITTFVKARRKDPSNLQREIATAVQRASAKSEFCLPFIHEFYWQDLSDGANYRGDENSGSLIIIDTLHPLFANGNLNIAVFLSSILQPASPSPQSKSPSPGSIPAPPTLIALYHADIPLTDPPSPLALPQPLSLLSYLATTILTVHSPSQLLAKKRAAARSLAEPVFGLAEEREGIIVGLAPQADNPTYIRSGSELDPVAEHRPSRSHQASVLRTGDLVLEAEFRRKSGRGIREWFYVPSPSPSSPLSTSTQPHNTKSDQLKGKDMIILDNHPLFKSPSIIIPPHGLTSTEEAAQDPTRMSGTTFDLRLTEKQRREREGVVLPYFDAQKADRVFGRSGNVGGGGGGDGERDRDEGFGEGGRILYDLGVEDDFDEEEDEI